MDVPKKILEQLGVTEEAVREEMANHEIPPFTGDTRRVEFQLVEVTLENGGAATVFGDMRLVSTLDGPAPYIKYAVFMRAAPSVQETEELRMQAAIDAIYLKSQEAEPEAAVDEKSNVISFLNAMGRPEEGE